MEKVKKLIQKFDGEIYDLCYLLFNEDDRHEEIFEYVCMNLVKRPEEPEIKITKYFTEKEIDEYKILYGDIIDGIIKSAIKKCDYGIVKEEEFYKLLWRNYVINFSSFKEKVFAFYYTLIDRRIPYVYIGKPLSMEQDKYEELIKNNRESIDKIQYIYNSTYNQKTEIASLILECINKIEDYESKIVVLAKAIDMNFMKRKNYGKGEIESIIKAIDRKIKELEERG